MRRPSLTLGLLAGLLLALFGWQLIATASSEAEAPIRLRVGTFAPSALPARPPSPSPLSASDRLRNGGPGGEVGPSLLIVQLAGPIRPEWKAGLALAGAEILDYVPDHAYLVRASGPALAALRALPYVRWIGDLRPGHKLDPALATRRDQVRVTIALVPGERPEGVAAQVVGLGGRVISSAGTARGEVRGAWVVAEIDAMHLGDLARLTAVSWIEPRNQPRLLNDVARTITGASTVNTAGLDGRGQIVAIADTGLDTGSTASVAPDFAGRILRTYALGRAGRWDDPDGHGTHVAGSAVGNGGWSNGQFKGVAPAASLVFQSVLDDFGGLGGIPDDIGRLFEGPYADGARVHSDSWGYSGSYGQYSKEAQDVDRFAWDHPDFIIVFAAGNDGVDLNADGVIDARSVAPPATAKNVLAVGASENLRLTGGRQGTYGGYWPNDYPANPVRDDPMSSSAEGLAAFSARGPATDGRIKPDIVAPGTNVVSVRSAVSSVTGWGSYDQRHVFMGGTSMATPQLAGAAALVRQFYQDERGQAPSAALIRATLLNGARDLTPGQYGSGATQETGPRPSNAQGWGRLDLAATLRPPAPQQISFVDRTDGLSTGQVRYYQVVATAGAPLRVTLGWTDYPASPLVAVALVNDLDLTMQTPDGAVIYPNRGGGPDRRNNAETIDIASAPVGTYVLGVRGYNVPYGPQPYALVVHGAGAVEEFSPTPTPTRDPLLPTLTPTATSTPTPTATPGGDPYEPNDYVDQAYGPIQSGTFYHPTIADGADADFFWFEAQTTGVITVHLTDVPTDADYDLEVYDAQYRLVASSLNPVNVEEHLSYTPSAPGRFFIRAYPYALPLQPRPYTLWATFDAPTPTPSPVPDGTITVTPSPTRPPATPPGAGGPDAYGYVFRDSSLADGPVFQWEDIRVGGTPITAWQSNQASYPAADDGFAGPFALGFEFPYYGQRFTSVSVGTNGYLTFGASSDEYVARGTLIPSPVEPNNAILVFGDDLVIDAAATVHYQRLTNPDRFVVQYTNATFYLNSAARATFSVTLHPSGLIVTQYLSSDVDPNLVGIENEAGTIGLRYDTFNEATPSPPDAVPEPSPHQGGRGETSPLSPGGTKLRNGAGGEGVAALARAALTGKPEVTSRSSSGVFTQLAVRYWVPDLLPASTPTGTPTPSPSATTTPTPSTTPTITSTLSPTPTATATATESPTPSITATTSPTPTSTPPTTGTPTALPLASPTATPAEAPTVTPMSTLTPTETPTPTTTPTATPPPIETPTATPLVSSTATATASASTAMLTLVTGWNLIALPLEPTATAFPAEELGQALVSQGIGATQIVRWNEVSGAWSAHLVGHTSNNFVLDLTRGYFVRIASGGTFAMTGLAVDQPRTVAGLVVGWNLIAVPYPTTYLAEALGQALVAQGISATQIVRWNEVAGAWSAHLVGRTSNDFAIERGRGYFVRVSSVSGAGEFTP